MILTCENCHTRYLLPSSRLGEEGRRVRCTICSHEWYQDYDDIEQDGGDENVEPIPESVRPLPEGSEVPSLDVRAASQAFPIGSAAASGLVFALVFAALIAFKAPVIKAWPESGVFYALLGMEAPLPGDGLLFEGLEAETETAADGRVTVGVQGNIVNLSDQAVVVPPVKMTLGGGAKDTAAGNSDVKKRAWYLIPAQENLAPQSEMPFQSVSDRAINGAREVKVGFTLDAVPEKDKPAPMLNDSAPADALDTGHDITHGDDTAHKGAPHDTEDKAGH